MTDERWGEVDRSLADLLAPEDDALAAARGGDLPAAEVSPLQGKLLSLLARACGAQRILELGTLGGYSTIWLARALPPEGRLISLEANAGYAEIARANVERAGLADRVDIRIGAALDTLPELEGPFDLVFIDADKQRNDDYLRWALELSRPGTLIVADNVVRHRDDAGVRRFFERLASDPALDATAIQTVGAKGWDGFALALVRSWTSSD